MSGLIWLKIKFSWVLQQISGYSIYILSSIKPKTQSVGQILPKVEEESISDGGQVGLNFPNSFNSSLEKVHLGQEEFSKYIYIYIFKLQKLIVPVLLFITHLKEQNWH